MIINYTSKRTHRPDGLGPNLVTNPGPFNNTTGWSAGNSATLSAVNGKLRVARNGVDYPNATQNVTVEIGELYLLEASLVLGTADHISFSVYDSTSWTEFDHYQASGTVKKYVLTKSTVLSVYAQLYPGTGTQYCEFSSVSVRKLTALGHGSINFIRAPFSGTTRVSDPWVVLNSTLSITGFTTANNKLRVTNVGAVNGEAQDTFATVVGKSYNVSSLYTEGTCTSATIYIVTDLVSRIVITSFSPTTTATTYTGSFTATGSKTSIIIQNSAEINAYNDYSSIAVTQADSKYTIEKDVTSESDERPSIGGWRQISIGGNAESNYGRKDEIHAVTADAILSKSEADDWKEFFDSCAGGETFTLDLYQDPRPKLIINGTFDTATTGWTSVGFSATLSVVSRKMRVTNTSVAQGRGVYSISTEIGIIYEWYVDNYLGTSASSYVFVGTSIGSNEISSDLMTVSKTYTGQFLATTTTTYFSLANSSTTSGQYTDFDNVSVKSIATDNVVSAILEGDGKIDRISQHIYSATFSYRVI